MIALLTLATLVLVVILDRVSLPDREFRADVVILVTLHEKVAQAIGMGVIGRRGPYVTFRVRTSVALRKARREAAHAREVHPLAWGRGGVNLP